MDPEKDRAPRLPGRRETLPLDRHQSLVTCAPREVLEERVSLYFDLTYKFRREDDLE